MDEPTSPFQGAIPKPVLVGTEQIEIASGPAVTRTTTQDVANLSPAIRPETGSSIKISAFPTPTVAGMAPRAILTGLTAAGANANYTQAQVLTGASATASTAAGHPTLYGGIGYAAAYAGGAVAMAGGYGYGANGGGATVKGGQSRSAVGGAVGLYGGNGPKGGGIVITSGTGSGAGGYAGNITITLGQGSGGATNGVLYIHNLPTSGTGLAAGAVYLASGAMKVK